MWADYKTPTVKVRTLSPGDACNLNELLKRLCFIASKEKAGNNAKEMEKVIDIPKGIIYLISYVSGIPKKIFKGSELVNNYQ